MTIDERLDRLTERHEALTHTIELMMAENRDRDQKFEVERQRSQQRWNEMQQHWNERWNEVVEAIARLAHIAQIHEQRITRLEGGNGS